jgi:hypothetical protein
VASVSGDRGAIRRRVLAALAATSLLLLGLAATAQAKHARYVPPHGRIFHGVSDTGFAKDFRVFNRRVGAHSALLHSFGRWDGEHVLGGLHRWRTTHTRGVLSISTAPGGEPELISPRRIARGFGDDYILELNRLIANSGQVVYIRLFGEMNGYWNPYCAFNSDGSSRGPSHSTSAFRDAWRRVVLIVRGGNRAAINRKLAKQGMPWIYRAKSNHDPVYAHRDVPAALPKPKVAFMWVPQTIGSPNIAGNTPGSYWPGGRFVDWIGADIYSKFATPGIWSAFKDFYRHWRNPHRHHWPFVVAEYSPWDNDYSGKFTRRLFRWALHHRRVRALIYYRSTSPNNEFDINHWLRARAVIRGMLDRQRFAQYARGTRH